MKEGKVLYLSTIHLTSKTAALLNSCSFNNGKLNNDSRVHAKGLYGWFIEVLGNTSNLEPDLKACMDLANNQSCDWLIFDREIDSSNDLPTYKW